MKLGKRILLVVIVLIIVIQFIPAGLPKVNIETKNDIITNNVVNPEIAIVLKTSCYDCHSNQTHYPWYAHLSPISWLLASDVEEGRDKLNFSEWNKYDKRRKIRKLGDIKEQVEKSEMPLGNYTLIHQKAKLNQTQKDLIIKWSDELSNKILQ